MDPVLVCLVCVVPCYTSIKGQYEIHTLTSLYGSLVVFGNHDLTRIFTLTEIGLVNNDVSCKSIAGPFLLRSKTIKARK